MITSVMKLAFIGFLCGEKDCAEDAIKYHEELKKVSENFVITPLGMALEEIINNPDTQYRSVLVERAMQSIGRMS